MTIARRLVVRGRVQGVGFRYAMVDAAREEGVAGWVRNRMDGSVEALVQGDAPQVERIIDWCRRGPPAARIAGVDVTDADVDSRLVDFALRPTA
jgi:acylphosphatase